MIQKLSSAIAEAFESTAFLMIGVSVFALSYPIQKIGLGGYALNFWLLLIARGANIFLVSYIINRGRIKRVSMPFQVVMWFSGLRGAMGELKSFCIGSNKHREAVRIGIFCPNTNTYAGDYISIWRGNAFHHKLLQFRQRVRS